MRVLVATGSYAGGLGAVEAARRLAEGWLRQAPHDQVLTCPLSDGSAGFVDVIAHGLDATPSPVVVTGPAGEQVPAAVLLVDLDDRRTAYLEAGQAAGRQLVPAEALADPSDLTSQGVGELLEAAVDAGATRVVVGCGDLASHDGGRGLLEALGAGSDLSGLPEVRRRFADVELVLAAATDLPLLGFHGASAVLGTEHGVPAPVTQALEERMGRLTDLAARALPAPTDLLTGHAIRPERQHGAGVGGGVGYALLLLGARPTAAAALLIDTFGLRDQLRGALLVTGGAAYDWRSVGDGVIAETARAALECAAPTVVLAQEVSVGRREGMSLGISGTYAAREGESLEDLAARVARTWSPPPRP